MSPEISKEIQAEQRHGRQKFGKGPDDFAHDDAHNLGDWRLFIQEKAELLAFATPREYRQLLVKIAGLAVSAIESFDRRTPK